MDSLERRKGAQKGDSHQNWVSCGIPVSYPSGGAIRGRNQLRLGCTLSAACRPSTLDPQPSILNSRLSTLDSQLSTKIALMTIVMVYHDNLRDDNRTYDAEPFLARLAKLFKKAVSQRTPRAARRRKLIEELSRNLPRNYQPKRKHLNAFSTPHLRTKIRPFWPPFVELPSLRVVRSCGAFYQPKCPVSRLFLGHRQTRKKIARAVCRQILFSAQKS